MTAGILIALPSAMLVMMMIVNPEYEGVLLHDPLGPRILGVAVLMQIVGALILWKVVSIEV
jgi:tight adherence protein B